MTDRELLELAAKAAGIEHGGDRTACGLSLTGPDGRHRALPRWNPLEDDGDALRLSVKLAMEVYIDTHPDGCACTEVRSTLHPERWGSQVVINHDGDADAATRRAIVRAAAELARIMP